MGIASSGLQRWFKRSGPAQRGSEPLPAQGSPASNGAGLILIVEDSKNFQSLLAKMLQQAGFATLVAADGETGLSMVREHRPDLVLTDLVMPRMGGFQVLRKIRRTPDLAELPVIVMSGNQQATEEGWSKRIGADGFLSKPFSPTEVLAKVTSLLPPARAAADA